MNAPVIGIDPGPPDKVSGVVILHDGVPLFSTHASLAWLLNEARTRWTRLCEGLGLGLPVVVVETLGYMGPDSHVGASIFETCIVVGRVIEAHDNVGLATFGISRTEVKRHLGLYANRDPKAKKGDAEVRAALIARFGGEDRAKGTKERPGPLREITQHKWAALAVACAADDLIATPAGAARLRRLA